jgi:hypothetical protein
VGVLVLFIFAGLKRYLQVSRASLVACLLGAVNLVFLLILNTAFK